MADLIVACVRSGDRYGMQYVTKLRNMVARHLSQPYRLVCLTDQPDRCSGVDFIDVAALGLPGWWAKMALFEKSWRAGCRVVYLDLDIVILGDLAPLAGIASEFAICENFTRLAGNVVYPCRYNSSVMVLRETLTDFIWRSFVRSQNDFMLGPMGRYGDQRAIEEIYPQADMLQDILPAGYLLNYRFLTEIKPASAIVCFGGQHKPDNCPIKWVTEAWR